MALTKVDGCWRHITAILSVEKLAGMPIMWYAITAELASNSTLQERWFKLPSPLTESDSSTCSSKRSRKGEKTSSYGKDSTGRNTVLSHS